MDKDRQIEVNYTCGKCVHYDVCITLVPKTVDRVIAFTENGEGGCRCFEDRRKPLPSPSWVLDILDKFEFFQGQRAGRELWHDKKFEVQEQDLKDFCRDIDLIRTYINGIEKNN